MWLVVRGCWHANYALGVVVTFRAKGQASSATATGPSTMLTKAVSQTHLHECKPSGWIYCIELTANNACARVKLWDEMNWRKRGLAKWTGWWLGPLVRLLWRRPLEVFGLDALPIGRCGHLNLTDEIMLFLNNVYSYTTYGHGGLSKCLFGLVLSL